MVRNRNEDTADSAAKKTNQATIRATENSSPGPARAPEGVTEAVSKTQQEMKNAAKTRRAHLHQTMAIPRVLRKTPGTTTDTTVTTQGKEDIAVIKARVRTGTIRSIPPSPTGDMAIHAKAGKMRP